MQNSKRGIAVEFVKVEAELDLIRYASRFSGPSLPIFAVEENGVYKLIALGEKLEKSRFAYYFESESINCCIIYKPKGSAETFFNQKKQVQQDYDAYNISIIELAENPFLQKSQSGIVFTEVKNYNDIIKMAIAESAESEELPHVYSFTIGNSRVIGFFASFSEDEQQIFLYSKAQIGKNSFFRYNFADNKLDLLNGIKEDIGFYVRIINLAEPFKFFKPE